MTLQNATSVGIMEDPVGNVLKWAPAGRRRRHVRAARLGEDVGALPQELPEEAR